MQLFSNSKVRDENGNLIVCYHGTNKIFTHYIPGDIGIHFGALDVAKTRADETSRNTTKIGIINGVYLNITNPLIFNLDLLSWEGRAIAQYFIFGNDNKEYDKMVNDDSYKVKFTTKYFPQEKLKEFLKYKDEIINYATAVQRNDFNPYNDEMRNILISIGYDGIFYPNQYEGKNKEPSTSYIVFSNDQIYPVSNSIYKRKK